MAQNEHPAPAAAQWTSAMWLAPLLLGLGLTRHVAAAVAQQRRRAEESVPAAPCGTAAQLSLFVSAHKAGSARLCPAADMAADLGTLKIEAAQQVSVVGVTGSTQPRFFGRFVLADNSGSSLLLQGVTVRGRNMTRAPGCAVDSAAGVYCLGAAAWVGERATLTATDATFKDLSASDGGALYVRGGTVMLTRTLFINANADFSGGAIFAALLPEPITIVDSFFESNTAGVLGGAILAWNSSSFMVCNSSFVDNQSPGIDGKDAGAAIVRCAPGCKHEDFLPTANGDGIDIRCNEPTPPPPADKTLGEVPHRLIQRTLFPI